MGFICRDRAVEADPWFQDYPVSYLSEVGLQGADEQHDADATLRGLGVVGQSDWIVVDHYGLGRSWERIVGEAGYLVAAIDDLRTRPHHADLVISDSASPFDPLLNHSPSPARFLVGAPYALIGSDYSLAQRLPVERVQRVLVTYGSADLTGQTALAVEALGRLAAEGALSSDVLIDVVIGPHNPRAQALVAAAHSYGFNAHLSPAGLATLMKLSDLVVTAGGNSLTEALALLRPCVVTVTADNQQLMVSKLQEMGLIVFAGEGFSMGVARLAAGIGEAIRSANALWQRIAAAQPFDCLGARRISEVMFELGRTCKRTKRKGTAR